MTYKEIGSYSHLPVDIAKKVRIIESRLKVPGFAGITLGRYVIVGPENAADGGNRLLSHELVHVRQWHELGAFGFLQSYLSDFVKNLVKFKSWSLAYREIGLEVEARDICNSWECDTKG